MTLEELAELTNIELFITSDFKSFVFTIELYDDEIEDISVKYYKVSKNKDGIPVIEKINNTIELLMASQEQNTGSTPRGLKLIKLDKKALEDEEKRKEFIALITAIETSQTQPVPRKNNRPYFTPVNELQLKLIKAR